MTLALWTVSRAAVLALALNSGGAAAQTSAPSPYGNVPPPSGKTWHLTLDDEFYQDRSINTATWNIGASGGVPWCSTGADPPDLLGNNGPVGGVDNCQGTSGTPGTAPYVAINPGVGLQIQAYMKPGCAANAMMNSQCSVWEGLQSYGKFTQRYGYFEITAQMPSDYNGEGDGIHTDIWLTPPARNVINSGCPTAGDSEIDIAENALGTANITKQFASLFEDGCTGFQGLSYPSVSVGPLSQDWHTYGLYWQNDGSPHGTVTVFFDGQPVPGSTYTLSSNDWDQGVYVFVGWMQGLFSGPYNGGAVVDTTTSLNNPLVIRDVRVWQAQ